MKRLICGILSVILACSVLSGCNNQNVSSANLSSTNFAIKDEAHYIDILEPALREFGETNDIKITGIEADVELTSKMNIQYTVVYFSVGSRELEARFRNANPELASISKAGDASHSYYDWMQSEHLYDYNTDEIVTGSSQNISSEEVGPNIKTEPSSSDKQNDTSSKETTSSKPSSSSKVNSSSKPSSSTKPSNSSKPQTSSKPSGGTVSQKNAVKKAKSYISHSAFSYQGLIGQLEYEKFSHKDAVYGADNCGADWNQQALKKAKSYISHSAFSYHGLIEQLLYEEYTSGQAKYGADNCGADWNEQAAKKAASYLSHSSFSRDGLIEQLEFEKFTHAQAVYGVEANGL